MSDSYDEDRGVTAEELAALVAGMGRRLPMVTAYQVLPGETSGLFLNGSPIRRLDT